MSCIGSIERIKILFSCITIEPVVELIHINVGLSCYHSNVGLSCYYQINVRKCENRIFMS
jgi:hypothetical protein